MIEIEGIWVTSRGKQSLDEEWTIEYQPPEFGCSSSAFDLFRSRFETEIAQHRVLKGSKHCSRTKSLIRRLKSLV